MAFKAKLREAHSQVLAGALHMMKLRLVEVHGKLFTDDNDNSHWLYLMRDTVEQLNIDVLEDDWHEISGINATKIFIDMIAYNAADGYCPVIRGEDEAHLLRVLQDTEKIFILHFTGTYKEIDEMPETMRSWPFKKSVDEMLIELDLIGWERR